MYENDRLIDIRIEGNNEDDEKWRPILSFRT